jgi:hypothetical protein
VRIAGWVLLFGGFVLCASVAWAALGFLLMGVGLISLQVAERNRNRAMLALAARTERLAAPPEIPTSPAEAVRIPTEAATLRPSHAGADYDQMAWRRLLESDSGLLRVTSVLQEYGQPYVDELARAYLADGGRSRLPAIVDAIVRKAKRNLARTTTASDTIEPPGLDQPLPESKPASHRTEPQFSRIPARASMMPPPTPVGVAPAARPVEVPPVDPPSAEASVDPPAPVAGQRNTTITSADDDLTELIGKFAPDSSHRHKD